MHLSMPHARRPITPVRQAASEGKLDPVMGRDAELDHVMRVLVRCAGQQ